jgi:hypothetical protein
MLQNSRDGDDSRLHTISFLSALQLYCLVKPTLKMLEIMPFILRKKSFLEARGGFQKVLRQLLSPLLLQGETVRIRLINPNFQHAPEKISIVKPGTAITGGQNIQAG